MMILSVRDLRVRAGERLILDGLSLDVRAKIRQMQMDEGLLNRGVNALRSPACASLCWHALNAALSSAGAQLSTE
jgi:hypothetical protein